MRLRVQTAMLRRLPVLFALGITLGFGQTTIPDTPAGRTLRAWLEAFNSGDQARLEAYIHTLDPKQSVEGMTAFRTQTGGFELLSIESSQPLMIKFRVKEKASQTVGLGSLKVKNAQLATVEHFDLRAIPAGAVVENFKLDAPRRQKIIDGIATDLNEFYVYPETAKKMADGVRAHEKRGDYNAITDGDEFAALLTDQLQEISHDKHLRVNYSPVKLPREQGGPRPEERAEFRKELERSNCAFEKVEVLPGNLGYLKFNMFGDPEICGATAVAAMNFLSHVDAVIFDLRNNGGGDPKMVALVSSYLFNEPTHLNDLYNRKEDTTTQYWTLPFVPGERLAGKPAFVLTSHGTFSGAEEFTYNLKNLKRATIVGETTGGGAHPVAGHRVDDHFMVGVPFARAINPITKKNWEGTGVEPDVPAKASDALEVAKKLALSKVQVNK